MARRCEITGVKPQTGNNVSHAKNRTKRRFLPNLHRKKFYSESLDAWISLRVSARGMRTIDKNGLDSILGIDGMIITNEGAQ